MSTLEQKIRQNLEANPTIQRMLADLEQDRLRRHSERASKDPERHKFSKVFPGGLRWRYFSAGKDGRGRRVRFCWSTTKNAAGYHLCWREVVSKDRGKRDQYQAVSTSAAGNRLSRQRMKEWERAAS